MCNDHKNNNSSLFIMGLILGAIIAGVIVLTSAEDKQKIIKKIKDKFNDLFGDRVENPKTIIKKIVKKRRDVARYVSTNIIEPVKKISVTIPNNVETLNLTPIKTVKPKKFSRNQKYSPPLVKEGVGGD